MEMTTITLPRAVVEQALKALEGAAECVQQNYLPDKCGHDWDEQIIALRAALAQQPEPVAWEGWWLHHGQHNYRAKPLTSERVKELMKLAFEVGQEAAPPPRKPLTEEEIDALPWNGSPRQFARAVEQAHGIKE